MNNEIPVEDLTEEFLEESIAAAPNGSLLKSIELRDTVFKKIEQDDGVAIGFGESDFSPNGADEVQEYDAVVVLVCYSKILGTNKTERKEARRKAFQISRAVAKLFFDSPKMNGRVCKSRVLTAARGFDSFNSAPYAVVNMPIVFNESGEISFQRRRTY